MRESVKSKLNAEKIKNAFFLKKVAEIFGGNKKVLYLCAHKRRAWEHERHEREDLSKQSQWCGSSVG